MGASLTAAKIQHALNLSNVAELAISGLREQQSRLASDLASLHKARLSEEVRADARFELTCRLACSRAGKR